MTFARSRSSRVRTRSLECAGGTTVPSRWRATMTGPYHRECDGGADPAGGRRHARRNGGMSRATATILFTDLVGSTELRGQIGEAAADELRRAHDLLLTEAVG